MEKRERSIFKVFIGSPGDVQELREAAFNTIQQLNRDPLRPDDVEVQGFGWDVTDYPKLINQPPQANIEEGLPDMAGNVWEWCLNKYADPYASAADTSGDARVLRGVSIIAGTGSVSLSRRWNRHYCLSGSLHRPRERSGRCRRHLLL